MSAKNTFAFAYIRGAGQWTTAATKEEVREKYGERTRAPSQTPEPCRLLRSRPALLRPHHHRSLQRRSRQARVPEKAVLASLGCGNPTALIELKPGEMVLDLGSGGGIDVLLSARRVGPTGKAYGLDMTDDMLALARENQRQAGVENVEFLKGEIENIPLPDNSVDVVISNCVINLSADKDRVLREAFRVLRPGGRFAVSDVVVRGEVPDAVRQSMLLWVGCIAGALEEQDYRAKLVAAGFCRRRLRANAHLQRRRCARSSSPKPASTSTPSRRRSKASSSAPSSAPPNPAQRLLRPILLLLKAKA